MRQRTALLPLWHPSSFLRHIYIFLFFNKAIPNSASPASDPDYNGSTFDSAGFHPGSNDSSFHYMPPIPTPHLAPFASVPDFKLPSPIPNSDPINSTPSSIDPKILLAAALVVIYGWSLTIASLLYVFDQYHFYIGRINTHMELLACWFLFVELVACWFLYVNLVICWFFSSWNLYINFSHRETYFLHGNCCGLIFVSESCSMLFLDSWNLSFDFFSSWSGLVHGTSFMLIFARWTCWVVIFVGKSCCELVFFFVKLVHWFFPSWNWFYSGNLLWADFC